jgi:hypothetical protein
MTTLIEEAAGAWVAPMSGSELGAKFGRSPRWGRQAVQLARRRAADQPAAAGLPVAPVEVPPAAVELPLVPVGARILPLVARPAEDEVVPAAAPVPLATAPASVLPVAEDGRPAGRGVATLAFLAGIVASVAANVGHELAGGGGAGAVLASAFWPVALLLAVETLVRVSWPTGRWFWLARYGGLTSVAAVAAAVSFTHMSGLLASWGEPWVAVHAGPVAVDGLMTMAAAALLGIGRKRAGR